MNGNRYDTQVSDTVNNPTVDRLLKSTETATTNFYKSKIMEDDGMLYIHRVCMSWPDNIELLSMILKTNPDVACAVTKKPDPRTDRKKSLDDEVSVTLTGGVFLSGLRSLNRNTNNARGPVDGSTPLHLLLGRADRKKILLEVVQLFQRIAPDVQLQPDVLGRLPLHLALERNLDPRIVSALISGQPQAACFPDKRLMMPLHVACATYLPTALDVIVMLTKANPLALLSPNFHGRTPLELAITTDTPDDTVQHLQQCSGCYGASDFVDVGDVEDM